MNKSLYGERDYVSGQHIMKLRTRLGLTQTGLASRLGVSRKAVAWWEAGSSYPTAEHLKQLIALGVQQQAFPAGREAEEILEGRLGLLLGYLREQRTLLVLDNLECLLEEGGERLRIAPSGLVCLKGERE